MTQDRNIQVFLSLATLVRECPPALLKAGIIGAKEEELVYARAKKILHHPVTKKEYSILRRSLDARKRGEIKYVYTLQPVRKEKEKQGRPKGQGKKEQIIVTGMGPAGLFCAWELAKQGKSPLLIERGAPVEERTQDVLDFWKSGVLNTASNVQFGEGGAGTFSDGKLNTLVKDKSGRNRKVLEAFVEFGAPKEILYLQKPHIGTDLLCKVIKNMREALCELGCEIRFHTQLVDIVTRNGKVAEVVLRTKDGLQTIPCDTLVLATGHSARDTFLMLYEKGLHMEQKAFAVGVRTEHPQQMIDQNQYGNFAGKLPAADYKLTHTAQTGCGVYSFCMCPGGFVVNASSEEGMLAVNGMSNYQRQGRNANSAIVVTVEPARFIDSSPLAGIELQRQWEKKAYQLGKGKIPIQLWGDFKKDVPSSKLGQVQPDMKGEWQFANLRELFPAYITESLLEAIPVFGKKIQEFDREDMLMSGVESRTSSPVRIVRNHDLQSSIGGLYPAGEGAGYAGGIMSAAMDGLKVAESILAVNEK